MSAIPKPFRNLYNDTKKKNPKKKQEKFPRSGGHIQARQKLALVGQATQILTKRGWRKMSRLVAAKELKSFPKLRQ
jgi:hypothetical protein